MQLYNKFIKRNQILCSSEAVYGSLNYTVTDSLWSAQQEEVAFR